RSRFDQVVALAREAIRLKCSRIGLYDSYSSLSVDAMKLFCTAFRTSLDSPIELSLHVHNDFGLATALALAAVTSGVNPEVAVNGVSYRSGFAAFEEVAVALAALYDIPTGINLERLQRLSDLVAATTGLPAHPLRPI